MKRPPTSGPKSDDQRSPSLTVAPDRLLRHTTLRQLQVFDAIVRQGSFTAAAQALYLTQPTVSAQMRKLSETLDIPLFESEGRHLNPTPAGLALHEACREIFEALTRLDTTIADLKGLRRGRLRLAVVTTAKHFAPEVLGAFSRKHPGIDVSLKVSNRERILERMHAREDDLYIMGQTPENEADVEAIPVAPNPLVVVAPRDHPLVGQGRVSFARMAREPLILREPGSGIRDTTLRVFREQGLQPRIRMELGSNEAIKHAVVGGLGVAVLSLHTLTLEGTQGPVAVLDVDGFPILRHWHLVHRRDRALSLVAQAFLAFALDNREELKARLEDMLPALRHIDTAPGGS